MISVIGAGNVAWHLTQALEKAGFKINEVYARNTEQAAELVSHLYHCEIKTELDFSDSLSELFILAVSDDAITGVASQLVLPENSILVHTSGTKSLDELISVSDEITYCGVLYPVMTFTKGKKVAMQEVPFCIEAENPDIENYLVDIAKKISNSVQLVTTEERQVMHISAVFACNFTNHLMAISKEIMDANQLDFNVLKPLIKATFTKALAAKHPAQVQTGPAIRHDSSTLKMHLELLEEDAHLTQVYRLLTKSIQEFFDE